MSIQTRLLLIYTIIFSAAFVLFAVIVYFLPSSRILAEIDADLQTLAAEITPERLVPDRQGSFRVNLPGDLATFETASTFMILSDKSGNVLAQTNNLTDYFGLLDPDSLGDTAVSSLKQIDNTPLRVYTTPLYLNNNPDAEIVGYLQVARLLNTYTTYNRLLAVALLVGFAAATASLFLAVWLTPGLFRPLDDIATVANQISRADDLSMRVPHSDRIDEIGVLARALNETLERLERLFQTQQRLLADVSHELRTPLTAIRGNVDLMRRMGDGDPESLGIIQEEVDRLTRLVGDLTLLARADAGGLPLNLKPVELDNLLFEVYRQVSLLNKPVEVVVAEVDQVCVNGDPDRLKQLLLNLVENGMKYTPRGGRVTVNLSQTDGWAQMTIRDNGVGIPAEDLPFIFDRFYRVDKARNRSQGGSGLGLAIAKWVAQAHGGDIQVESEVNVGTTFTVVLPLLEKEMGPEEMKQENGRSRSSLRLLTSARRKEKQGD
ncbi:MAG: HAMP domain-containing histidine kinase [Chloroflexi bacterium]|nr:HAMP domain-containing histidine kinase [Chloroflexota bacterium]MBP7042455.1 HAMP domain-containing histidine kinase [Chloroflexota bacterium]